MQVQEGQTFSSMFGENGSKTIKKELYKMFSCYKFFFHMIEMITCLIQICRKNIISVARVKS